MTDPVTPSDQRTNHETVVAFEAVRFRWSARSEFELSIPRLSIAQGESVMLVGPSGSGKSTLLSLICGVLTPTHGTVTVLDHNLASLSSAARDRFRAEHIGVIFQQFNLLPYGRVFDNIILSLAFAKARRSRVGSDQQVLKAEVRRLMDALDLDQIGLSRRATDLSIGQQQRVAVARALIGAPDIVIADEPTSALDANTQSRFLDLMFTQVSETGATLLMVTHDDRLAHRFSRVIQLDDVIETNIREAAQ